MEDNPHVQPLAGVPADDKVQNCKLQCRASNKRFTLRSSASSDCYCTDEALKAFKVCDGNNEYRVFSNGLGFAPVSFTVNPTNVPTETLTYNSAILDSQIVKVNCVGKSEE